MTAKLVNSLKKLRAFGWKIKEYGLEDKDEAIPNDEEVQYVIFEKNHNWIYVNIWPGHNHKDNAVTFSPHVNEDVYPYDCSITMNFDELTYISNVINNLHSIDDLEETNGQNN